MHQARSGSGGARDCGARPDPASARAHAGGPRPSSWSRGCLRRSTPPG